MYLKAQVAVEYAFIAALVVSLVVLIAVPVFREVELSLALENARRECVQIAWENGVEFAQLDYSIEGRTVTLAPRFYYANGSIAADVSAGERPLHAISTVFRVQVGAAGCVNVLNYEYCAS